MFQLFNTFRHFPYNSTPLLTRRVLLNTFAVSKPKNTLFDRLGGEVTLDRTLDIFHDKVSNDKSLKDYFKDFSQYFKDHQRKTLRIAFGDPTGYTTRDIKAFHDVSHIKEKDWENYIGLLKESLTQVVPNNKESVSEAISILEKYRRVVVEKTVFEKLSKNVQLIHDVVGTLFDKLLTDRETRDFFITYNVSKIKQHLNDYMVNLLGGPNQQSYKDTRMAHKTLDLNDRHFYIFKKHLNDALRFHSIESGIIDEVLFIVEKQRNEVLNRISAYEIVGYEPGVIKLVDRMYELIPEDPVLKNFFEDVDLERVKEGQRRFISFLLGGPKYIGKDMKTIHGKMNLADAHFDAFKSCFETVLKELNLKEEVIRDCTYQMEKHRREVCSINLFELIGGEYSVLKIVKRLTEKIRENEQLKGFYKEADDSEINAVLRAELMHALGGPLSFRGRDVKSAHEGLFISKEQFKEYNKLLFESMKETGVVDNLIVQVIRKFENKAHLVISKEKKEDLNKQSII